LVEEALSRRSGFREGTKIRLADGQMWTMPAPPGPSEWPTSPFDAAYTDLMRAIEDTQTRHERSLAELTFAIFLLGHNYCLSPDAYERLLGFSPGSHELTEWQSAVRSLTQQHLQSLVSASVLDLGRMPTFSRPRRFFRLFTWVRDHLPPRWWFIDSRTS
jgi:hypothetical protein